MSAACDRSAVPFPRLNERLEDCGKLCTVILHSKKGNEGKEICFSLEFEKEVRVQSVPPES